MSPPVANPPAPDVEAIEAVIDEALGSHDMRRAWKDRLVAAVTAHTASLREKIEELERRNQSLVASMEEVLRRERNASHSDLDAKYDAEAQERRAEKAEAKVEELERGLAVKDGSFREMAAARDEMERAHFRDWEHIRAAEADANRMREALENGPDDDAMHKVVEKVVRAMNERRGLRQALDGFDEEDLGDFKTALFNTIGYALKPSRAALSPRPADEPVTQGETG